MKPGDRIKVVGLDGVEKEDIIHSVRYRSAQPEIRQHPTGWRRIARQLTPRRWRKPLPITRPYQPANTEVICKGEVQRRYLRMVEDMNDALHRLGVPPGDQP